MTLSQKSRVALYQGLSGVIPEEGAVEELLSQFPSRDLDEPVTKDYHRAENALLRGEFHADMAELRTEMADLRTGLRTEMADLRSELRAEMADLRTGLRTEMADLRSELRAEMADLGSVLRIEMHRGTQRLTVTLAALMVSMTGVIVAALTVTS